jgi:hypothetical protein
MSESADALALDENSNVYIAGQTFSQDFPLSAHAVDDTLVNSDTFRYLLFTDGFVSKFHIDTLISDVSTQNTVPSAFRIASTYPNPFNPSTTIEFYLPEPGMILLKVYSMNGQKVYEMKTEHLSAGLNRIRWNGKDSANQPVSSGSYLIHLENGSRSVSQKVLFMK